MLVYTKLDPGTGFQAFSGAPDMTLLGAAPAFDIMGLGTASGVDTQEIGAALAKKSNGFGFYSSDLAAALQPFDAETRQAITSAYVVANGDLSLLAKAQDILNRNKLIVPFRRYAAIWGILGTVSMAASVYHGYKRNQSVAWAIWWGIMGSLFPVVTPVVAVAQGFGKPRGI